MMTMDEPKVAGKFKAGATRDYVDASIDAQRAYTEKLFLDSEKRIQALISVMVEEKFKKALATIRPAESIKTIKLTCAHGVGTGDPCERCAAENDYYRYCPHGKDKMADVCLACMMEPKASLNKLNADAADRLITATHKAVKQYQQETGFRVRYLAVTNHAEHGNSPTVRPVVANI
jgi:hypothetical protein